MRRRAASAAIISYARRAIWRRRQDADAEQTVIGHENARRAYFISTARIVRPDDCLLRDF